MCFDFSIGPIFDTVVHSFFSFSNSFDLRKVHTPVCAGHEFKFHPIVKKAYV